MTWPEPCTRKYGSTAFVIVMSNRFVSICVRNSGRGGILNWANISITSVVDENIDATKGLYCGLDRILSLVLVCNVELVGDD
jgi:hypothetical protein